MRKILIKIGVCALLLVFFSIFFSLSQVTGSSMEPTLKNGQLIVSTTQYLKTFPQRSDIILYTDENGSSFVGRVIALPSESIRIGKGNVYIDDNNAQYKMLEEYISSPITHAEQENVWIKMGQFNYFILKDNRKNYTVDTKESTIEAHQIKGRVLFSL